MANTDINLTDINLNNYKIANINSGVNEFTFLEYYYLISYD